MGAGFGRAHRERRQSSPEIESNFGLTKSLLVGDAACFCRPVHHSSQSLAGVPAPRAQLMSRHSSRKPTTKLCQPVSAGTCCCLSRPPLCSLSSSPPLSPIRPRSPFVIQLHFLRFFPSFSFFYIGAFVLPEEVDGGTLNALVFSEHRHNKDQRNPFKLALRDRKLKIDPSNTWGLLSTSGELRVKGYL